MLEVHAFAAPNSIKVPITLEEPGLAVNGRTSWRLTRRALRGVGGQAGMAPRRAITASSDTAPAPLAIIGSSRPAQLRWVDQASG